MRAGELGLPAALVPLLWVAISFAKGVAASRAGPFADRVSPHRALARGWLVFAAAYGGLALTTTLAAALSLMIAVGVGSGLAEPAERKLVAALAPSGHHGGAFGWYALVQGLMALPAGLLAGSLWDTGPAGSARAFAVTAGSALAACCLLAFLPRESGGARAP